MKVKELKRWLAGVNGELEVEVWTRFVPAKDKERTNLEIVNWGINTQDDDEETQLNVILWVDVKEVQ